MHFVMHKYLIYVNEAHMSPTLSGSSALWRVEVSDAHEIHNRTILDFYLNCHIHRYICVHTFVAVPGRSLTLFRCVFQPC